MDLSHALSGDPRAELCTLWSAPLHTQLMKNKKTTKNISCVCYSQPEEQAPLAFLATFLLSSSLFFKQLNAAKSSQEKKKKYKWFIKNLLFMKVKRGARRNRAAVTERPSEALLLFCLTLCHPRAPPESWHPTATAARPKAWGGNWQHSNTCTASTCLLLYF